MIIARPIVYDKMFIHDEVTYSAYFLVLLRGFGGSAGRSHGVADVLGFPESLNHHGVHGREVSLDNVDTPGWVSNTEVLLQVESVLGNPERISHVGSDHLQALNALVAGETMKEKLANSGSDLSVSSELTGEARG